MNETKLTKEALYVPSIVFESGTLSSSSEGKVTWNGEELGGSTLNASGDITFTGLDTFTQYVTFNGGMICNSDIVLNGTRLLLANGAAVEIYQGTDIPLPEGGGDSGSITPGTGNSGGSIDTSNFAKLNEDNTFTGNNNFTGTLTLNDKSILTTDDLSNYVTNDILSNKNYLTSSALTDYAKKTDLSSYVTTSTLNSKGYLTSSSLSDYAKKTDLNSYATTSSLSSYIKTSTLKSYITATGQNGTSWYRKYSDGWIEQGGNFTCPADSYVKITYLSAFANTNYSLLATSRNSEGDRIFAKTKNINTTYAEIGSFSSSGTFGTDISWFACGY